MATELRLDSQAQALLKQLQKQTGPVGADIEEAIGKVCSTQETKLSAAQLSQVLLQAMPEKKQQIQSAEKVALCYHPDGKNAKFLTQILDLKIEKEFANVYQAPRPIVRTVRDPYTSTFSMDPKADFLLLFNARDVDRNGQPLLMKVVARDKADLAKLDLTQYRTQGGEPDVTRVANDADYVEISDTDEAEFSFGDPLKQVSLDTSGNELSTTVKTRPTNVRTDRWFMPKAGAPNEPDLTRPVAGYPAHPQQGEQLDRQPVVTFNDRALLKAKIDESFIKEGGWTDSKLGKGCEVALVVDRGFMFEPGSEATFQIAGAQTLKLNVPEDDAQLLGSPSGKLVYPETLTLHTALNHQVTVTTKAATPNQTQQQLGVGQALLNAYPDKAKTVTIAGQAFAPFTGPLVKEKFDEAKIAIDKTPLPDDPDSNGQRVRITLKEGFLAAAEEASVKGWKVVAGYKDESGKWHGTDVVKVASKASSGKMELCVDVGDAPAMLKRDGKLEIRVFNQDNVPAQAIHVPLRSVKWAA